MRIAAARLMLCALSGFVPTAHSAPIPVHVAVVVTFDGTEQKSGAHGEFTAWAQREKWIGSVTVPGVDHPILLGPDGVVGVVQGTTSRGSIQLTLMVLSGQFDFSHTYWVINGIAGVDPAVGSIASAAWAHYVIDGDVAYEIDSREGDPTWPYGIMPIGSQVPNQKPKREGWEPEHMSYKLNSGLVDWAYGLTRSVTIPDTNEMQAYRSLYAGFPNAQRPPFVLTGETFGCNRYWHGRTLTRWAEDWTKLWTDGQGTFAMSDMEDQGYAAALERLSTLGKVDFQRVLFLRTASNYCMQPPKGDINKSLHYGFAGYLPSLEAAYRVGSVVVHELAGNWPKYAQSTPHA